MSTPTPSNAAHASKAPHGHNAATPNNMSHLGAFSSPAMRSAASPAAHRNTISGKSPLNAAPHNHPTGSSAGTGSDAKRGALLGSSPAGAAINFDSPSAALGLNLGHTGGVDMGVSLSQMGGIGMGLSMSGLGIGMSGGSSMGLGGRPDEGERRLRLEHVAAIVKKRPERVGEEGIRRVAKGLGLATAADEDKDGKRPITLAGTTSLMGDIQARSDVVEKVKVECEAASEVWKASSEVLYRDLTANSDAARINITLDKFQRNLEILARIEKLSGPSSVNCFSAISGVYTSLKKLFEHEKKIAAALFDSKSSHADQKAEREVMCKRRGRPRMNSGDRVGLSIEYWMDRRHVFKRSTKSPSRANTPAEDHMDVDKPPNSDPCSEPEKIYSIQIECDSFSGIMYPPVRITDSWISDAVEKAEDDVDAIGETQMGSSRIDWQDPPPTYVPEEAENIASMGSEKLPTVRFMAHFNPPLILPLNVVVDLHQQVQDSMNNDQIRAFAWDSLALHPESEGEIRLAEGMREVTGTRLVYAQGPEEGERIHKNSLFLPGNEFGMKLEWLPFEHPRQLVQMLPTLRQFAMLNTILQTSFPTSPHSSDSPGKGLPRKLPDLGVDVTMDVLTPHPRFTSVFPRLDLTAEQGNSNGTRNETEETDADLDEFLGLSLATKKDSPFSVSLEIGSNAEITVIGHNVELSAQNASPRPDEPEQIGAEAKRKTNHRLAKALDITEDLNMWVEWLRVQASKSKG